MKVDRGLASSRDRPGSAQTGAVSVLGDGRPCQEKNLYIVFIAEKNSYGLRY